MKKAWVLAAMAVALSACAGADVAYNPAPQILPQNIRRLALRLVVNKTQQFGLEDKFTLRIRDEFLRDGRYPLVPEDSADGIVAVTITRYLNVPIQYDSNLIPTAYKLRILVDLQFIDRATNTMVFEEPNMEGIQTYAASTMPGGLTEEQAREQVWDILAPDIVKRVIDGFGTVTGESQRRVSGDAPSTQPAVTPNAPLPSVVPNPY